MTNWYSIFYWLTVADGVKQTLDVFSNWFLGFTIISFIIYIIFFVSAAQENASKEDLEFCKHWRRYFGQFFAFFFITTSILWIAWTAVPTKKDALIIIAGGAVGNFITTDTAAKALPSDVLNLLRVKIKEEINETSLKKALQVETDTLKNKSKEELLEIIKNKK